MRFQTRHLIALLLFIVAAISPFASGAQTAQPASWPERAPHSELAFDYSYVHSNAPPGICDCFNMNGMSATYAWLLKPGRFAAVGDFSLAHSGNISSGNYTLTLTTFTFGARYFVPAGHSRLQPFGQVLAGLAHASGSLVQAPNSGASNAGAAFAAHLGGGLDFRASSHMAFRLAEADYLVTTFDNNSNNHQNNLRLSGGLVMLF